MLEGWQGDDYLILFNETESAQYSAMYEISNYLANYLIVGIKGWDDFVVEGSDGTPMTVPTVPIATEYLKPLGILLDPRQIQPDVRFSGKVKWYVKPLIFGGDPSAEDNLTWVSLEQHAQLVKWWNDRYRQVT